MKADLEKLEELAYEYQKANEEWANEHALADFLEEQKKTIMADEFLKAKKTKNEDTGKYPSDSIAEYIARSSDKYKEHIEEMIQSRRDANVLRGNRDTIRLLWESARSSISYEKSTFNAGA